MTDTLTLTGIVATTPRHLITGEGLPITNFRLACAQRRFDRRSQTWVDGDTNWYTVSTYRDAALNAFSSLQKGDRVIVRGKLRIRDWESGEKRGTNVDIDADAFGHDLRWGKSTYERSVKSTPIADVTSSSDDQFLSAGNEPSPMDEAAPPDPAERAGLDEVPTPF